MSYFIVVMGLVGFFLSRINASSIQFEIDASPVKGENHDQEERQLKARMLPVVINTWPFTNATNKAWEVLSTGHGTALDAVEQGCTVCEEEQCDYTVGYGGSPDENGETTLDAMIMDGPTHGVGAVAGLRRVKHAISVARKVMEHTKHTMLIGEWATKFAFQMGFPEENLNTNYSENIWHEWRGNSCQPNFWRNVDPDPSTTCGPYKPIVLKQEGIQNQDNSPQIGHDTIGMLAIDKHGNMASGTSTNGARHKIPGRVGDSAMIGSGSYVDKDVGGAAATGDGDILMRYLPSLTAVENLRNGMTASVAAREALERIIPHNSNFSGAIITLKKTGEFGAACHGFENFTFSVVNPDLGEVQVVPVTCSSSINDMEV